MIAIIGYGFVGQAVHSVIKHDEVIIVDPKRGTTTKDERFQDLIAEKEGFGGSRIKTIIVCVGTPENSDGSCNISQFLSVYKDIKDFNGLVLIKSTLPKEAIPPNFNFVYNPEFLNANTAVNDFALQDYIVLGGDIDFIRKAKMFYKSDTILNTAEIEFECTTKELASDFKYIRNIYSAYKVLFWEFVQDRTGNARKLAQMLENIPLGENTQVGMDGVRGFDGACLPKDLASFESIKSHELTKFMIDYNDSLYRSS